MEGKGERRERRVGKVAGRSKQASKHRKKRAGSRNWLEL
jgi:hypothetical protein